MKKQLSLLIVIAVLFSVLPSVTPAAQAASDGLGTITEYTIPTGNSITINIVAGPDGALWFAEMNGNKIGRITSDGTVTEYPVPTGNSAPGSIVTGPDGALWFNEMNGNKIGRITTDGTVTEYPVPTGSSRPNSIAAGPDGALWFTEYNGNNIGRISTTGAAAEYSIPSPSSGAVDIAAGPDGAIWFAENLNNKIGRVTMDGTVAEYPIPTGSSGPRNLVAGPDGAMWFSEFDGNKIGRITEEGTITEYPIPTLNSSPANIVAGPDGALWFIEMNGNKIGRIAMDGTVTEYSVPTGNCRLNSIVAGPDGALWFIELQGNKIGRITTDGTVTEYPIPTLGSSPTSIVAGPDNALWFIESSVDKIGRITASTGAGESDAQTVENAKALLTPTALNPVEGADTNIVTKAQAIVDAAYDGVTVTLDSSSNTQIAASGGAITYGAAIVTGDVTFHLAKNSATATKTVSITVPAHTGGTPGAVDTGIITEYSVPTGSSAIDIATGPDGAMWFTEMEAGKIGRITTDGAFQEYAVSGSPYIIVTGPDGAMWFTEPDESKIGRITMDRTINEYTIPSNAYFISAGPNGELWFTEPEGGKIGRITTAGAITEYPVPSYEGAMTGIAAGSDGAMWFANENNSIIGRITMSGVVTLFSLPSDDGGTLDITAGPDGAMWFTEPKADKIGRIAMDGTITEYSCDSGSSPTLLTAGPDNAMWFTEPQADKIGRITMDGTITEFSTATGGYPAGIAYGRDGNMWFTEFLANKIGKLSATSLVAAGITSITSPEAGSTSLTMPTVPDGYTIAIATSSNTDAIAVDGTIASPATATTVNLTFIVTNATNHSTALTASIPVTVPAGSSGNSDATLASVAGKTDSTPGTQSGADAADAIAWEVSVDNSKPALTLSDITAAENANVKLYSNPVFTAEITGSNTLHLTAGGTTTAYIKVTSENGETVKYYAVAITRVVKLNAPTGLAWDSESRGKAIWGAVSNAVSYTVQMYKDGLAAGSAVTGITNTYYDFSAIITESGVYTFAVIAAGNGAAYDDSEPATVNSALSVYAVNFKRNYNGSDTTVYQNQMIFDGGKAAMPEQPARSGYTFGGWYTEAACTNAWNFKNNRVIENTILYAKWTAKDVTTYTATYDGNGATSGSVPVDSNDYVSGASAKVKANTGSLAKAGYILGGWSSGGTTYTAGQTITISGDVTLTAVWIEAPANVTYIVTYNNNYPDGGRYTSQTGIMPGSTLTAPPAPSRSGYTFIGWYKDAACADACKFDIDVVSADINLYAKWTANTYTVSGTVVDDAALPASVGGALVKVVQGNIQFGTTAITDGSGSFTVAGIPDGAYNLIVTKDSQEVTVCITVSNGDYTYAGSITLPKGNRNSRLDVVGSETPNVVVDNLNNVFKDSMIYDSSDETNVAGGGTVEIKLTVQKNDYSTNKATVEAAMSSSGYTAGIVLDIDMTKTSTSGSGVTEESPVTATNNLIKIIIPLPAALQGKAGYVIYRAHDYGSGIVVDALTTTANANEEYIEINGDKSQVTAYLKYFSTYAVAYTNGNAPQSPPSQDSSAGSLQSFAITAEAGQGGSISPSGSAAVFKGADKEYTIKADKGYLISDVLIDGKSVGAVASYTFTNVNSAHTIKAVFAKIEGLPYYADGKGGNVFIGFAADIGGEMKYIASKNKTILFKENPKTFKDISGHWAKAYIDFVTERELFLGTVNNAFSPDTGMTRAMFAAVIGRLYERSYGKITTTGTGNKFADVDYDEYYGEYVAWAVENSIVDGVRKDRFEPDRKISREEMAVMLYRFAGLLNLSVTDLGGSQLSYPDASAISAWAADAAKYCRQTGIISGRDGGKFVPKGVATRAEVAVILQRFIENTVSNVMGMN